MRKYNLIVGDRFSLSNETDCHVQSDYFPGIWAIKTKKSAMKFAKQIIAEGDEITRVTDYDNPTYHAVANEFIQELGIKQPLFAEPKALKSNVVTNSKPNNLSQLKKYYSVGVIADVINYDADGEIRNQRRTSVLKTQTNAIVFEKTLGSKTPSWLDVGKASDWTFENRGATKHYINKEGKYIPSTRIEYVGRA